MGDKVLLAMSGGVDSSLSACLLLQEGYEVVGVTFFLYKEEREGEVSYGRCCSPEELSYARRVAEIFHFPHYLLDREELFSLKVLDPFVEGYLKGTTPNPCIACNREVKFSQLFRLKEVWGCRYVATGHYARVDRDRGRVRLLRGKDLRKDQSYFLYTLTSQELEEILFPVGEKTKEEVRELAKAFSLPNAEKKDSMDLCFLPEGGIREFFKRRGVPLEEGPIYDEEGNLLGIHEGIAGFTVGQRRGLKVSYGEPLYVKSIHPETNTVVAGRRETVFKRSFSLLNLSWISGEPSESEEVEVQIRYRSRPVPALLKRGFDRWEVVLEEPVVPTPGQSAVFYRGEEVLGGGIIFG